MDDVMGVQFEWRMLIDGKLVEAEGARVFDDNEHADEILAGLGLDESAIIDLKVRGVVA